MLPSKRLLAAILAPVLAFALASPASGWADTPAAQDREGGMTRVTVDVSQLRASKQDTSPLARTGDAESLCTGAAIGGIVALGAGTIRLRRQ